MQAQLPMVGLNDTYDKVDLSQAFRLLRARVRTILLFTILASAAALLYVLFATPQFTSQGALYLGETQQSSSSSGDANGTVDLSAYSTQSDVETQIELLTTGTLITRAALETGLNTAIYKAGKSPLSYWRWRFLHGGDTRYFLPGPQSLQVVNATLAGHYMLETGPNNSYKLYTLSHLFRSAKLVLTGTIGQPAFCSSGSLLVRFAQATTTTATPGIRYRVDIVQPEALAKNLANGMFSVSAGGTTLQPTKLASLQLRWPNPYQAMLFVNQMMNDYIVTQLQWKTEAASVTENFVGAQLAKVSNQLSEADQNLSAYQAQTGIIDPQQSAQAAVTQMAQLQSKRADMLLTMQALQQMNGMIAARDGSFNQYLISQSGDPLLSRLGTSLSQAEVELSVLEAEYTQNAQNVKVQQAQVRQLRLSISSLIRNDLRAATQSLADIDNLISTYRSQLESQPAESLKVATLKRNSDQLGLLYKMLTQTAEQAQISKAATIIDTRIVTPSQLPLSATSPRAAITLIAGALAGFLSSLALIFAQHGFSGRYESEEQIRRSVPLPIYGTVPRQVAFQQSASPQTKTSASIPNGFNAFSESFQLIKRNIYRHANAGRAIAVLVISANPQDGKTTIAANLARSLSDDGRRVLLLNCDIYVNRLENAVNFSGLPGLTDWMHSNKRPAFQRWPDANFQVLPAGVFRPERRTTFDEIALTSIIEKLSAEFDYLIFDSPPLPIVSDGLLLGSFADLILSVVNVSHTMRRSFELHNELINTLKKPHGLIINGTDIANYGNSQTYFHDATRRRPKFNAWFHIN
ncbi:MAG: hypothetical protein KGQ26_02105 [Rhodospirillales bacterium]|nr:hypothetical protein [Rhodospirillales bacterium]